MKWSMTLKQKNTLRNNINILMHIRDRNGKVTTRESQSKMTVEDSRISEFGIDLIKNIPTTNEKQRNKAMKECGFSSIGKI